MINIQLSNFKEFREINNLKQQDIATYLGVSRVYISQVENNKCKLSEENVRKLLTSDWDTSVLTQGIVNDSGVVISGQNNISNSPIDNRHYYSDSPDVLKAQIELLDARIKEKDAQIKEKDAQINSLLAILSECSKKNDSQ